MRGWIGLAIIGGIIYYFATETNKLDKPIEYVRTIFATADKKVSSMTGTTIQRIDHVNHKMPMVKEKIYERLSTIEIREFDGTFIDSDSIAKFKQEYCSSSIRNHPVFSRDNLQFICDQI